MRSLAPLTLAFRFPLQLGELLPMAMGWVVRGLYFFADVCMLLAPRPISTCSNEQHFFMPTGQLTSVRCDALGTDINAEWLGVVKDTAVNAAAAVGDKTLRIAADAPMLWRCQTCSVRWVQLYKHTKARGSSHRCQGMCHCVKR